MNRLPLPGCDPFRILLRRHVPARRRGLNHARKTYGNPESTRVADTRVHHGVHDRAVGAFRLLRHTGPHHLLHGAAAGLRRRTRQPHLERCRRPDLRGAGNRRLDRGQGAGHPAHHAARRGDPGVGLRADDRAHGEHLVPVRRAGVIVVGNGLFKANAGNLVRKIYEGDDSRIDSAFTIYYMAVNIGSTVSMLLTPWIKDYINDTYGQNFGWHAAFAVCSLGLLVGLGNYLVMRHTLAHIGSEPDHHPFNPMKLIKVLVVGAVLAVIAAFILQHEQVARWFVILAAIALLLIFVYLIVKSQRGERAGLAAALILTLQTIFFFIFYQQMPTSLALFALRNTDFDWSVFGVHLFTWLPGQYQALNPIWIMILSPILAWIYTAAGKRGKDLSIASKFALGFAMVAAGYFVYGMAGNFVTEPGKASSWVLIWGYGLYSLKIGRAHV